MKKLVCLLPVMDGYEATRVIRMLEEPALAGIPILAMTANAFEEDRKAAMESGMNPSPLTWKKSYRTYRVCSKAATRRDFVTAQRILPI